MTEEKKAEEGEARPALPPACTLIIFGGSGDLAHRKLIPAVYNLFLDDSLAKNFAIVGIGRKPLGEEGFRQQAHAGIVAHSRQALDPKQWEQIQSRFFYLSGEVNSAETYRDLKIRVEKIEADLHLPGHRIFYLAIPPTSIAAVSEGLRKAGLIHPPSGDYPLTRIIVEKPIGRDLATAREINRLLGQAFDESQIFRIDHYLGKETVQNLLVLRFANGIFEPLWNHKYIDHVQIAVSEDAGIETRSSYYEEAGALRDIVQNHILQLLCLVAMEPPWSLEPNVVRDAKLAVLQSLRPLLFDAANESIVRAQYIPGIVNGIEVPGYRRESGVKPDSTTETFVALQVFIDNWRWAGVPFYLRTGKRLSKRATEISVQFKEVPSVLFNANRAVPLSPNVLTLRIQPEEGFSLSMISKKTGSKVMMQPVEMAYQYGNTAASPEAYERLLLDVMNGDSTLFMRRDEVEASWKWITGILQGWATHGTRWLPEYTAGSPGPVEADRLIEATGRKWRAL